MEITNKFLKKVFAIGGIFLYCLGFGVTHFNEASNFMRIVDANNDTDIALRNSNNGGDYTITNITSTYLSFTYNYLFPLPVSATFDIDISYTFSPSIDLSCDYVYTISGNTFSGNLVSFATELQESAGEDLNIFTSFYVFASLIRTSNPDGYILYVNLGTDNGQEVEVCDAVVQMPNSYVYPSSYSSNIDYTFYPGNLLATAISDAYTNGYDDGIAYVLNNLNDYNLYSYADYLAYGSAKYNEGLEAGSNVLSMSGVINEIFKAPITMFTGIFNSDAFQWRLPTGEILDIGGLMTFLLTIGIALAIVRLIMKVGGK